MTSRTSIPLWSVAGLAVAAALAGCGGASSTDRPAASGSTAASGSGPSSGRGPAGGGGSGSASASPLPRATTERQCEARPDSSGDILVRSTTNGQPAVTQQLGGAWNWDAQTRSCNTAVEAVMLAASGNAGNCTQVAYVSDNPGYHLTAAPAPPLKKVLAAKGPAC